MKTILATLSLLALPTAVLAHPGHLANAGYGHSHYIALAIILGVAAIGATHLLRRVLRRSDERTASKTELAGGAEK